MNIETVPFNLYKTNIALQLRITQLLQECRQRWLESARQRNADSIAQTETDMKDLLHSTGWQSLGTLRRLETYGRLFQVGMSGTRTISQTVIENQGGIYGGFAAGSLELATGSKRALRRRSSRTAAAGHHEVGF